MGLLVQNPLDIPLASFPESSGPMEDWVRRTMEGQAGFNLNINFDLSMQMNAYLPAITPSSPQGTVVYVDTNGLLLGKLAYHEYLLEQILAEIRPFISVDRLTGDGKSFDLREPLSLTVRCENGLFVVESELLKISAFGSTRQLAIDSFGDDFAILWREIAQEPDSGLSMEARNLKSSLLSIVEDVTDLPASTGAGS